MSVRETFKFSILSLALLGCASISFQTLSSANDKDIETLVTTANRTQTLHLDLIGNTNKITKQSIEQSNAKHLNQLLSQASSTWLSRGNGQESLLSVRSPVLTGAGSCAEFLTLENGISLRAPGFCNVNQLFDTHFELADNIEVVKGANSSRYGSNAIHGTINVFSPSLYATPMVSVELGEDSFYRVNGLYSQQTEALDTLVGLTLTSDGGFQDSSGYEQQKLSLSASHSLGDWQTTHRVTLTNLEQDTAGYLQRGENAYQDKSLLRINDFPDAYRNSLSMRYAMFNTLNTEDAVWQVNPYLRHTDMDFLMHFLPGTPVEENGHSSIGLQVRRASQLSDMFSLTLGSDIDITRGFLKQNQANDTESNSAFLRGVLPQGKHYDYDVDALSFATYAQLDAKITDEHNAFAALRYDNTDYDYQNNLSTGNLKDDGTACGFGGCRYTRPASQSIQFDDISYALGYSYKIDKKTQLFAKHDQSFRAPHTSELYRLQNGQLASDVKSVKARQTEVGVRYIDKDLFAELSVYHLKKKDGIYQDADRQYLNGLDTEHQGIEFALNRQVTRTISTKLAFSYSEHTYLNNPTNGAQIKGNDIDTAPKLLLNLQINWQVTRTIMAQLERQQIDDYFLDAANTQSYAGHKVYNLRADWQINPQLSASFAVMNITDERYAERADFAFGNHRYFVGEPRNMSLKLKYQF
ncbi:TonB-dependent receptor [Pseudoalteromonas phenolica]|uniref:TonB-dependent receptor n=1 Tax=Pseudoalteromonas phenolica TaxID=161398 RepID=UPI001F0E4749|nr:TonB-dependent receptor [Pseudoalteromonas phenolica]